MKPQSIHKLQIYFSYRLFFTFQNAVLRIDDADISANTSPGKDVFAYIAS